jgi:tight adherence protein B
MTPSFLAALVVLTGAWVLRLLPVASRRVARWPRLRAPVAIASRLRDVDAPASADVVWTGWSVATASACLVAAITGGRSLALVVGAALVGAPAMALAALRGRSGRRVDAALPALLEGVARSLRSGATLQGALDEQSSTAGRLGDDLRTVVGATDGGVPLVVALDAWPDRCPTPGVRLAVAALALAAEAGGAAARAVDGVAATLRANLAVAGEVRAQAAQARLSGLVIALAPLAFATLAAGTDRRTAAFLLHSSLGAACLAAGLALDGLAAWWMHRITAAPV